MGRCGVRAMCVLPCETGRRHRCSCAGCASRPALQGRAANRMSCVRVWANSRPLVCHGRCACPARCGLQLLPCRAPHSERMCRVTSACQDNVLCACHARGHAARRAARSSRLRAMMRWTSSPSMPASMCTRATASLLSAALLDCGARQPHLRWRTCDCRSAMTCAAIDERQKYVRASSAPRAAQPRGEDHRQHDQKDTTRQTRHESSQRQRDERARAAAANTA